MAIVAQLIYLIECICIVCAELRTPVPIMRIVDMDGNQLHVFEAPYCARYADYDVVSVSEDAIKAACARHRCDRYQLCAMQEWDLCPLEVSAAVSRYMDARTSGRLRIRDAHEPQIFFMKLRDAHQLLQAAE